MIARVEIATYRGGRPAVEGQAVVIERRDGQTIARRVGHLDSDDPIHSFAELAASMAEAVERSER